jgi:hypothetical protein
VRKAEGKKKRERRVLVREVRNREDIFEGFGIYK